MKEVKYDDFHTPALYESVQAKEPVLVMSGSAVVGVWYPVPGAEKREVEMLVRALKWSNSAGDQSEIRMFGGF